MDNRRGVFDRTALMPDLLAGLTAAAVVVPSALAYATLAGLPAEVGLYTALPALLLYALLGTSRVLSVSVTSTIAILTATAISHVAPDGDVNAARKAAVTLALLAGIILIVAAALRLGGVTAFISAPVLVGFRAGMGLLIASSQLGKLLGVPFSNEGFLRNIRQALRELDSASGRTIGLSIVTVVVLLGLRRLAPSVPGALVGVAIGIGAEVVLDLQAHGVALVDKIPSGLPSLALPSFDDTGALFPAALGIALMSSIESFSAARSFARPDDPRLRPNREWLALGAGNIGAAFTRGFPAGGGTSQTAINARSGARTRFAGIVTAAVVVMSLTLLASLFSKMPEATLGALVFVAAVGLVQPQEFSRIRRVRIRDWALALAAFAAVLFLGALSGILVAVLLSMLTLLIEANRPRISVLGRRRGTADFRPLEDHPGDETIAGLRIVRPEGSIYFANADHVHDELLALVGRPSPRVLLIDGRAVPDLEYTALESLGNLRRQLERSGVEVWVAALNPRPLAMLLAADPDSDVRTFATVHEAVDAYKALEKAQPVIPGG